MKLSKVNTKYGAPMGRSGLPPDLFATRAEGEQARVRLARVRLDSGGYDSGGAYWGHGQPLFYANFYGEDMSGDIVECFLRADSREHAKKILLGFDSVKFYR